MSRVSDDHGLKRRRAIGTWHVRKKGLYKVRCVKGVRDGYIVPYGSMAGAQTPDENCNINVY